MVPPVHFKFFGEFEKGTIYPLNSGKKKLQRAEKLKKQDMDLKNDYYRKMPNKKSLIDSSFGKLAA